MSTIERQLLLCINKISMWSVKNEFKFSKTKTVCTHFCLLRPLHHGPELFMDGEAFKVVEDIKILELPFCNSLSFIPHMKSLRNRGFKVLDIIKVLAKN